MLDFKSPCGSYVLTFDDDGKVAYAFLKRDGNVLSSVWLYNRCPTPAKPEWSERNNIPFANCAGYMSEGGRMEKEVTPEDVLVDWEFEDEHPVAY